MLVQVWDLKPFLTISNDINDKLHHVFLTIDWPRVDKTPKRVATHIQQNNLF